MDEDTVQPITGTPRSYGLNHDFFRPEQKDAIEKCFHLYDNGGGIAVIEAPTGVGKSAIATAMGKKAAVTAVVSNHGLMKQYANHYGFKPIYGKQEYPCVLKTKIDEWRKKYNIVPTAGDCHLEKMEECSVAHLCPYLEAKMEAIQSQRMVCTYKYAFLSQAVQSRNGILVMDEVHNAVEDLLDVISIEISNSERIEYGFDPFPSINYGPSGDGDLLNQETRDSVIDWVVNQCPKVASTDLFDEVSMASAKNRRMYEKLQDTLGILSQNTDIFYSCYMEDNSDWKLHARTKPTIKMIIRSLDVSRGVRKIRGDKSMSVLMSATIGIPHPLMNSLGINHWWFMVYPHPVPKEKRPVYDLGIEKMTHSATSSNPALYAIQSNKIIQFINGLDKSWRGIVLTTSNFKVRTLRKNMRTELGDRVIFPEEGLGLLERIDQFVTNNRKGIIAVDTIQGWGSGLSLTGDLGRFAIVAGVPYMNPNNRFEKIRMSTEEGRKYSWWKPFSDVAQATGRVTRGEKEKDGTYSINIGAIADGSGLTPQAKSMYPRWFNEAIVKI
jgi:Rad3-related DNA helicase